MGLLIPERLSSRLVGLPCPGMSTDAPEPPIACTLDAAAVPGRVEHWEAVRVTATDRSAIPGGVRLTFGSGVSISALAELVATEQACCSFFAFAITVDARGVALEVTAPPDAQAVVERLFGVAS
jgi:MerR family copper efflux transcriptional regulator